MRLKDELKLQIKTSNTGRFTLGDDNYGVLGSAYLASNADLIAGTTYDWVDVLDGTLSIRITRGVNQLTGVSAVPVISAGTMRITTRNRNLDPYTSRYMKPKKTMRLITADGQVVFIGKIDAISVDYRSDKEQPIITFDVVDPVADLQQAATKLNDPLTSRNKTWNQRITEILTNSKRSGITKSIVGGGVIRHDGWGDNKTVWQALLLAQTTESGFIYFDRTGKMWAYGKGNFTPPDATIAFSNYDESMFGFKSILVDANSDSIINEIQVENSEVQTDTAGNTVNGYEVLGPYRSNASVNTYGAHVYAASTNFYRVGNTKHVTWADNLLNKNAQPQIVVKEITWNAKLDTYKAAHTDIGHSVTIAYRSEYLDIFRDLTIVGIVHEIDAANDNWHTSYSLFEQGRFS